MFHNIVKEQGFSSLPTIITNGSSLYVKNKDFKRLRDALSDAAQFNHLLNEI